MLKRYLLIGLIALLPCVGVAAQSIDQAQGGASRQAADQLQQFVQDVASASGQFTQVRLDEAGQPAGSPQSGAFSFERPGKFKWHVKKPYDQLTLSDGKKLYQYDPDLAQVIVRSVDESVGASPAAILFGSGALSDAFDVTARPSDADTGVGADAELSWLRATPRTADAGFTYVDIGFKDNLPQQLLLLDSFGQITRISLTSVTANPTFPADEFTFTPPDGADVVQM